jgi:hypothetical protein
MKISHIKIESGKIKRPVHYICLILLILALLLRLTAEAATTDPENAKSDNNEAKPCELVSFTVKAVEGKNYVNWCAIGLLENHYFVLERSEDGKNYSIVKISKSYLSPKGVKLQYSFIDEKIASQIYYKITLHKMASPDEETKQIALSKENKIEKIIVSSVAMPAHHIMMHPSKNNIQQFSILPEAKPLDLVSSHFH